MTGALAMMMAANGRRLNVTDPLAAQHTTIFPAAASAKITFKRNGQITNHLGSQIGTWIDGATATIGDGYKVKFDRTGGSQDLTGYPAGASDNVYTVDISADRTFTLDGTTSLRTSTGTFTVSDLAGTETDSASGTFEAEVQI